jgi:mono/diheme cytochrome c family protein
MIPYPRTLWLIVYLFVGALSAAGQKRSGQEIALPSTPPTSGSEMFRAYCADCHGSDGKGNGPIASFLKIAPPDLTTLAARNSGNFPYDRVYKAIDGETYLASHGSREMAVWGPVFRTMGKRGKNEARQRITTLTEYLASLQPQAK